MLNPNTEPEQSHSTFDSTLGQHEESGQQVLAVAEPISRDNNDNKKGQTTTMSKLSLSEVESNIQQHNKPEQHFPDDDSIVSGDSIDNKKGQTASYHTKNVLNTEALDILLSDFIPSQAIQDRLVPTPDGQFMMDPNPELDFDTYDFNEVYEYAILKKEREEKEKEKE